MNTDCRRKESQAFEKSLSKKEGASTPGMGFCVRFSLCFRAALPVLSLILALLLCAEAYSLSALREENGKKRVWVFFSDKGSSRESEPRSAMYQIPAGTRIRRQHAQGCAVNAFDLPVFQPYIDEILRLGAVLGTTSRWLNGISADVPEGIIPKIRQLPYVKSIEPVATYRRQYPLSYSEKNIQNRAPGRLVDTTGATESYGMAAAQIQQIQVNKLHDRGYHGEGVTIAVLDSGFDLSHEAFRNINVLAQYDFVNDDSETSDEPPEDDIGQDDHGTEVLSIIAGNSPGKLVGVAYAARYLLAKTERVSYKGLTFEQEIEEDWWVAGLEWAELNGADVVSSSLGYSDWYSYRDMNGATAKTTVAANIAVQKGVAVVVSAGNEGKSRNWPYITAPADGFDVLAVGAVNYMGEIADFSSIGPTYDGRIKPDVVAMGENTCVVEPESVNGYLKANGTSMATPLVAGTLAILRQALPDLKKPEDLVKLLKYTASRALSPDNRYGWGIINAEAAFRFATFPGSIKELDGWDPMGSISDSSRAMIYPNPIRRNSSIGGLNIHSSRAIESIKVYTVSGTLVYERNDLNNAKFLIWDLKNKYGHDVANGVYICVIEDSTGAIDKRKIAIIE